MSFPSVRPISNERGFGKHRIGLFGGVFVYEVAKTSELASAYFPQQHVEVSHAKRFDGRRLLIGVCTPLLVLVIGISIVFGVGALDGDETSESIFDIIVVMTFVVTVILSFIFTIVQVVRFFIRVRTTILSVDTDDGMFEFEFWHPKGKSGELDDIVGALASNRPDVQQSKSPTVGFDHDWSYTRPLRTALKVMLATLVLVWIALLDLERVFGFLGLDEIPNLFGAVFLLFIPIAGLASFAVSSYRLARAEPGHSTALMHFINRDYDLARKDADHILDAQPDDPDGLMIAVHTRIRQGKPDESVPYCQKIDDAVPGYGTELFSRIMRVWNIDAEDTTESTYV